MKTLLFCFFGAASLCQSVNASVAQIDADIFARSFCAARANGVPVRAAARLATDAAVLAAPAPSNATGEAQAAVAAAFVRCPAAFGH